MTRICHLSSAHNGLDIRIFRKECVSLAKAGYETHLVINATDEDVAEGNRHGVAVHPLRYVPESRRFSRMGKHALQCYRIARSIDADLYHFHDPELIPYAMALASNGKKVIFDAHEDLPGSIYSKDWVPAVLRPAVANGCRALQYVSTPRLSGVVAATPYIARQFASNAKRVEIINNFPLLHELPSLSVSQHRPFLAYVGGIESIRGIRQMIRAMDEVDATLLLAGKFATDTLRKEITSYPGWRRVKELGFIGRQGIIEVLSQSFAGLVVFNDVPNFVNAQPIKMFEYMAAGVPVIASDFPLWREFVEGNDCGICVNGSDPHAIAKAIAHLQNNPEEVVRMGRNGHEAVKRMYRWENEEAKLVTMYRDVLGS